MRAPNNKPTKKTEDRLKKINDTVKNSTSLSAINITDLIQEILGEEKVFITPKKRLCNDEDITIIKSILSEYFQSFLIMGYGIDGKRLLIKHTQNEKDEDSLVETLRFVFMKMIQGG